MSPKLFWNQFDPIAARLRCWSMPLAFKHPVRAVADLLDMFIAITNASWPICRGMGSRSGCYYFAPGASLQGCSRRHQLQVRTELDVQQAALSIPTATAEPN